MADDIEVKSIEKGFGKTIKIKIAKWKNNNYLDIREYYDDENGEPCPTKKGVRVSFDVLDEIIDGINLAKEKIAEE